MGKTLFLENWAAFVALLYLSLGCSSLADKIVPLEQFPDCAKPVFQVVHKTVLQPKCGSCHGVDQAPFFAQDNVSDALDAANPFIDMLAEQATNNHCFNDGCNNSAGSPEVQALSNIKAEMATCEDAAIPYKKPLTKEKISGQFRKAALTLCDRLPTLEETKSILDAPDVNASREVFKLLVERITTPECVLEPMLRYHRDLFEVGSEDQGAAGIAQNRPARLGAYIVANDKPYTDILTAKYCIDQETIDGEYIVRYNIAACVGFGEDVTDPLFSGIMTDGQIHYRNYGTLHFRIMNFFSTRMMGKPYPDTESPSGLTMEQLPQTDDCLDGSCPGQPINFRVTQGQICHQCHQHLNERVGVFWRFSSRGVQQPFYASQDPNGNLVGGFDPLNPSTFEALQVGGTANFRYYGQKVSDIEELGQAMVSNEGFAIATARHVINRVLGKSDVLEKLPSEIEGKYAKVLKENNYSVRHMIQEFLTDSYYLEQSE